MSTNNDTDDATTYSDTTTLHGGGQFTYCLTHPRERSADTEHELRAIRAAVDGINADPSFSKNIDGDVTYRIDEGYYPGEWTHVVDVTDLPVEQRHRALLTAQSQLCQRGYIVNSLRTDDDGHLEALHVVSLSWVYSARAYGRQQAEEGDDA